MLNHGRVVVDVARRTTTRSPSCVRDWESINSSHKHTCTNPDARKRRVDEGTPNRFRARCCCSMYNIGGSEWGLSGSHSHSFLLLANSSSTCWKSVCVCVCLGMCTPTNVRHVANREHLKHNPCDAVSNETESWTISKTRHTHEKKPPLC